MIALLIIFVLLGRKPADVVYHMKISYSESLLVILDGSLPNGLRYAPHAATRQSAGYCVSTLVRAGGRDWAPSRRSPGTRQRRFDGTNFKPHKLPEKRADSHQSGAR